MDRPLCKCHGEPMRKNTDKRYTGGVYWRCAVRDRAQSDAYYYERMPFHIRGRRMIEDRRNKALMRRRERQLRRESGSL